MGTRLWDAFQRWRKVAGKAPGTYRKYEAAIGLWEDFGILNVEDALDLSRCARFIEMRMERKKARTVIGDVNALVCVLDYEERQGNVPRGSADALGKLRPPAISPQKAKKDQLTPEEFRDLCSGGKSVDREYELAIEVDAYSGLRIGELVRLHTDEIDYEARLIHVRWLEDELGEKGRIKTKKERWVPIEHRLLEALRERAPRRGYVFPSRENPDTFIGQTTLRQFLKDSAREAGLDVERVNWKLLRATRACWWAATTFPAFHAEWMGHSVSVAMEYYVSIRRVYDPSCEAAQSSEPPKRAYHPSCEPKGYVPPERRPKPSPTADQTTRVRVRPEDEGPKPPKSKHDATTTALRPPPAR